MKIILFLIALTFCSQSFAKLTHCQHLNVIEGLKNGWKIEVTDVRTNHSYSFEQKLAKTKNLSARGLRLLHIVDQETKGQFKNKTLITDVNTLIKRVNKDSYSSKDASYKMLSYSLPKLQSALDTTVFYGQMHGNCDVHTGKPVRMSGIKSKR